MATTRNGGRQTQGERHPPKLWEKVVHYFGQRKRKCDERRGREKQAQTENSYNERIIAIWTRRLGIWTVVLGIAAVFSAYFLYETMVDAGRAWIAVIGQHLGFVAAGPVPGEGPYRVEIQYANVGHSPATRLLTMQRSFTIPWVKDLSSVRLDRNDTCSLDGADLGVEFPDNPVKAMAHAEPYKPFNSGILRRESLLVVQGCFKYSTFGFTRRTGYCFVMTPEGADNEKIKWAPCPGGLEQNFAD